MLEDGSAHLYDSAGKTVPDSLKRQLRVIFGPGKRIDIPPLYPQMGNNCLVNASAMATNFALSKQNPENAQGADGASLRQWFNRILFKETNFSAARRKRGARRSEKTAPLDSFIIA